MDTKPEPDHLVRATLIVAALVLVGGVIAWYAGLSSLTFERLMEFTGPLGG